LKQGVQRGKKFFHKMIYNNFFFFCGTRVWTQDLHLEPLHQPFYYCVFLR
jgi:hypothetical protein